MSPKDICVFKHNVVLIVALFQAQTGGVFESKHPRTLISTSTKPNSLSYLQRTHVIKKGLCSPIYIWRLLVKQPLTPPARTVIHPAGRTFHPSRPQANRRTWLHLQLSRNPKAQNLPRGKKKKKSSLCNFLLLSLAAKGKFEIGQGRAGRPGQ